MSIRFTYALSQIRIVNDLDEIIHELIRIGLSDQN